MTLVQKQKILSDINEMLDRYVETETEKKIIPEMPVKLLTVKECAKEFDGLSEHTIRQLAAQGKIPTIRAGQGSHGKILINKFALLDFLRNST